MKILTKNSNIYWFRNQNMLEHLLQLSGEKLISGVKNVHWSDLWGLVEYGLFGILCKKLLHTTFVSLLSLGFFWAKNFSVPNRLQNGPISDSKNPAFVFTYDQNWRGKLQISDLNFQMLRTSWLTFSGNQGVTNGTWNVLL